MTDSIAFLSNASANIETVIGFSIGAAIATLAAFIILGLAAPVAYMRLEDWRYKGDRAVGDHIADSIDQSQERERSRMVAPLLCLATR